MKNICLSDELIMNKIYHIRGQNVMLDKSLADLYGVSTKVLNQAVKRNIERFPPDFMFQLSKGEWNVLRSQFVTLEEGRGKYTKYHPNAFTEQGLAMLSGVLKSETAIGVHIHIIRVFAKMKEFLLTHKEILLQLQKIEKKMVGYDSDIALIFEYIKQLINQPRLRASGPVSRKAAKNVL